MPGCFLTNSTSTPKASSSQKKQLPKGIPQYWCFALIKKKPHLSQGSSGPFFASETHYLSSTVLLIAFPEAHCLLLNVWC
jgi:hypothetical protein